MYDRKAFKKEISFFMDLFDPGNPNVKMYSDYIDSLDDKAFGEWIDKLESGEETLAFYQPNFANTRQAVDRNVKIGKALGHEFRQRIWQLDDTTGQMKLSNAKYLIIRVPVRRQVQMLFKKMSIPETNTTIDERSGQVTGPSKGGRLSYPEIQINAAKGLDNMVTELIKFRGGDEKAYRALTKEIFETGKASMESIGSKVNSKVKSSQTLSVYLKAAHINSNL